MVLINGTNVKFLINSVNYNGFISSCLNSLISSLRSQVSNEDIVVVQGNSNSEGVTTETNYTLVKVKHNSMELTALIAVLDNQSNLGTLPDVWFYLHDTCDVGPNFITRLNTMDLSNDVRVHWSVSNLGVYKNSTLVSNSSVTFENIPQADSTPAGKINVPKLTLRNFLSFSNAATVDGFNPCRCLFACGSSFSSL